MLDEKYKDIYASISNTLDPTNLTTT